MVRARPRWRVGAALALALCIAATGCSFVLVEGPPEGYREMESFTCTEGDAVPILDVLWSAANGIAAAQAWLEPTTPDRREIMIFGSSMAVASGISAAVGFRRRTACRQARVEMSRARQTRPARDTAVASIIEVTAGTAAWPWSVPLLPPRAPAVPPLPPAPR